MDENNPNNPRTPHSVSTVKSEVSLDLVFRFFTMCPVDDLCFMFPKVASSNTSHLEAHAGFFRLLIKGIFNPYVL